MAQERTLSIIKPDAVADNLIGAIYQEFERNGLQIVAAKMVHMTLEQAKQFYQVHAQRPFYNDLVTFISRGPVMVSVLEGEDAIAQHRRIMGATNPKEAAPESIRGRFAKSIDENAVHGSDAAETAVQEIAFFFKPEEICRR